MTATKKATAVSASHKTSDSLSNGNSTDDRTLLAALPCRMTNLFMDGADPIVIRNLDGHVVDMNKETERVFGWSLDDVKGARTRHLLLPEYRDLADAVLARVQQGETVRNVEAAVRTKSGGVVPVLATIFLLKDDHGQPIGYAEIAKDISQLKETNNRLQQHNQELKQFANILAHDLGAPLRTVRGFANLLERHAGEDLGEKSRENLYCIVESVQRMDRLVGDLLEFTRIERHELTCKSVDMQWVFDEAVGNLHAAIEERHAQVVCDDLPNIRANPTRMIQLLQNLIGNAIKFCGDRLPRIRVSAQRLEDEWQFSVDDNGIGIDEKQRKHIFEIFSRLHNDGEIPGTGIGLAICKTIVEHHGGRIWIESTPGDGSTFYFTIPDPSPTE